MISVLLTRARTLSVSYTHLDVYKRQIPDSVTSIGKSAFFYCMGLRKVTIPSSVTSIGEHAFNLCDSLSVVYYTGTEDEWKQLGISEITNSGLLRATIRFLGDQSDLSLIHIYPEPR